MARPFGRFLVYVRPTFMLPAVGMSVYGGALSTGGVDPFAGTLHSGIVGLALYLAHLRDGYVDGHRRGEETPRLTVAEFRWSIRACGVLAAALSGVLFARAGLPAALSTAALVALALLHAPYVDRHPVGVTVDYPIGVAVALLGGYATQTGGVTPRVVGVAVAFVGLLSGIKIGIDRLDADFDGSIGKRTVPVAFGSRGADWIAAGVFAVTAAVTGAAGVGSHRPTVVVAAASVPIGCLLATVLASPGRAVRIQMGLTYAFAALLFLGVCDACAGARIGARTVGFAFG